MFVVQTLINVIFCHVLAEHIWKGLVMQAEPYDKSCKISQQFKKRKTVYVHLPPKNIVKKNSWDLVHVELMGPYSKSIIQHNPSGSIIINNVSITCMTIFYPGTGWFQIFKIPTCHHDEVTSGNNE